MGFEGGAAKKLPEDAGKRVQIDLKSMDPNSEDPNERRLAEMYAQGQAEEAAKSMAE
jgi:hypothetical protein